MHLRNMGSCFFVINSFRRKTISLLRGRWGPININRFFAPVAGYPQIAQVLKEPETACQYW